MSTIDALVASIDAARARIDEASACVARSIDRAEELLELCQQLGVTDKANEVEALKRELEAHQAQLSALADQADEAWAQAEALRGDGRSSGGGTLPGLPPVPAAPPPGPSGGSGYPHNRLHEISWSDLHHVLNGDPDDEDSGGHAHGTGRPNKTEFPHGWDDEDVTAALKAVAERPDSTELKRGGNFLAAGVHRGITVKAVVRKDGSIAAGWPVEGAGVKRNPPRR